MNIYELETPAIVVDLDCLERNLASMAEYARGRGLRLRPHTKTHKIAAIALAQIHHGSSGITVAKTEEAEVMVAAGCDDILVAYPVYGASKWDRLARLALACRITVAVDAAETIQGLSAAAQRAGSVIGILVEFDVGMRRCGVDGAAAVVGLAQRVVRHPGLEMRGVMYYPGHIWDHPEAQGPALAATAGRVAAVLDGLQRAGIPCPIVSGGSTPTARNSHLVRGTTEIRPGTYVFNDRNTLGAGACERGDIALRVIAAVVSTAVPGRAIVDSGSKTLTNDRWISGTEGGHGIVDGFPDVTITALSEEHGHLDLAQSTARFEVGQRVAIIPNHVCPCVNLHDRIHFHRHGTVEGFWMVDARGRVR